MYFERNGYDAQVVGEAQNRLQTFQGASSISSSQYFGRDEEEEEANGGRPGSADGLLGDGSLGNLEVAAKDALARVMANQDVQNVGESIRAGAMRVSTQFMLRVSRLTFPFSCSFRIIWRRCRNVEGRTYTI